MKTNPDEDAMIAAVQVDRFDDGPMLVYADWLQERGEDIKAEYLRLVVHISRRPETPQDLAKLAEIAGELPQEWREQVGSRFEIVIEGNPAILLVAHLFNAVLSLAWGDALRTWEKGKPIQLKTNVTREAAEEFVTSFGPNPLGEFGADPEDRIRFRVRPMDGPSLGLVLPTS